MRPQKTLADYVAIAICPALIMALTCSLMYFLLEVLYGGPHNDRMRWAVFFFVMGIVLIARISMTSEIADRAGFYGVVLAIAAGLVLNKYIEYPENHPLRNVGWLINLGLMALIWWSAHRLTWDCTLIDDDEDASGQGLLEAAGIERGAAESGQHAAQHATRPLPAAKPAGEEEPSLWQRVFGRTSQKKRGHTPGVWIVYYSLAALPLFGLGQMMIPASEPARRRYVFWLLVFYVAAGLGLLLATSFLGLRRYLRQKKLQMPAAMTGAWLLVGGTFLAVILAIGALLPRPNPEYVNLASAFEGKEQRASRHDILGGKGAQKGAGREGSSGQSDKPGGSQPGNTKQGQGKDGSQGQSGNSKQGQGNQSQQGKSNQGGNQGKSDSKEGGKQGDQGQGSKSDKSGQKNDSSDPNNSKEGNEGERNPEGQDRPGERGRQKRPGENEKRDPEKREQEPEEESSSRNESRQQPMQEEPDDPEPPSGLAALFKWIVYLLAALAVLYVLIRYWRQIVEMLKGMLAALRDFWARLFGWRREQQETDDELEGTVARPPPPFSSFRNPFLDGNAEAQSVNWVTRYTFRALEAWAYDHSLGRKVGETPIEFAQRLSGEAPALAAASQKLSEHYSRMAYARAHLTPPCLEPLRVLWSKMTPRVREMAGAR
jgi:hypothetical protein